MDSGFDTLRGTAEVALALAEEMTHAAELIRLIGDADYAAASDGPGSVGGHFRHNLNFVEAVLNGAELGRIDYANRVRDERIETDRTYAAERFIQAIAHLLRSHVGIASKEVSVVSELDGSAVYRSSVGRELEFALSHTIHHHALIAQKLRSAGVHVDANFGVAPSTRRFWNSRQAPAP